MGVHVMICGPLFTAVIAGDGGGFPKKKSSFSKGGKNPAFVFFLRNHQPESATGPSARTIEVASDSPPCFPAYQRHSLAEVTTFRRQACHHIRADPLARHRVAAISDAEKPEQRVYVP